MSDFFSLLYAIEMWLFLSLFEPKSANKLTIDILQSFSTHWFVDEAVFPTVNEKVVFPIERQVTLKAKTSL